MTWKRYPKRERKHTPDGSLGDGRIEAVYPSGRRMVFNGKLIFAPISEGEAMHVLAAMPNDKRQSITILDPRAIVTVDEKLAYHPRAFFPHLEEWARNWLMENKSWAPVAGITDNAAGAWPKGTRVRKTTFEAGDGHKIGELGTVEGSAMAPDGRFVYSVLWDDNPSAPVACLAYKIDKLNSE